MIEPNDEAPTEKRPHGVDIPWDALKRVANIRAGEFLLEERSRFDDEQTAHVLIDLVSTTEVYILTAEKQETEILRLKAELETAQLALKAKAPDVVRKRIFKILKGHAAFVGVKLPKASLESIAYDIVQELKKA